MGIKKSRAPAKKRAGLRQQAEAAMQTQSMDTQRLPAEEIEQLIHELQVHQIELEVQNEELRQSQQKLAEAHHQYADLYDFAPVGYFTFDKYGLILAVNQTGARQLGRSRSSLLQKPFTLYVASDSRRMFTSHCLRVFETKTHQTCEVLLVKKDHTLFWARLESMIVLDRTGNSSQFRMALIDISEQVRMATALRKAHEELELQVEARTAELSKAVAILEAQITERQRAEEALQESQARLKGIISTATDAIITIDAEQRIILFNVSAEQVFQYQAEAVIGQPLNLLLPERFRAAHARHVQHFGQTGVTARRMGAMPGELWGRRADGEEFPIEAMISQVEVSGQKFYTVILRDITQRKQVEAEKERLFQEVSQQREQLRALTRQLAEAQEVERKQLARELHDQIGQSLTALDLNLNLIWAQLAETELGASLIQPRLDDSLVLIAEMGERIRNVMADLRPPMLDDYGLVEALRWYSSRLAARAGFTITLQGEEPMPRLAAPVENALFRIAQEALTNVAKHAQASQVTIIIAADKGTVRLVIADDGLGFEPISSAKSLGEQGWGMLTMTERAKAVGGHCHIEAQPGQGTRVIVEVTR